MLIKKLPIETKTKYIIKNIDQIKTEWVMGRSFQRIAGDIREKHGLSITKQMLSHVLSRYVSLQDRAHRAINIATKPNKNKNETI